MQLSYDYAKDRALMCLRANYESHLLCGVLTAAGAILPPMTSPKVVGSLSQHGSVWPSIQRGGSHIRSRLPRRVCHAAPIWDRFWPKSHAVCHAQTLLGVPMRRQTLEPAQGGRRHLDAFRKNRCLGSLPLPEKTSALIANPVLWVCYDWLCRYF